MMTFSTNAWWPLNDMQSHLTDVMGEKIQTRHVSNNQKSI